MTTMRYTYQAEGGRRVTVKARDEETARDKAVNELDRRMIAAGSEPPVNHGLTLIRCV